MTHVWQAKQRILSKNERDLGLGLVEKMNQENQTLSVFFPLSEERRTYSLKSSPPIKRFLLRKNQTFQVKEKSYKVKEILFESGFAKYECTHQESFWEYELPSNLEEESSVLEKILSQDLAPFKSYDLRKNALSLKGELGDDRLSGMITSRVDLLPHQVYLAHQISAQENPRVLLGDEVGLGKTIEAGLIYSCLNALEKANRVLIVTPSSLVHQWAQEMARSFGTLFSVMDDARYEEEDKSLELSPFESNPKVLISLDKLTSDPKKAQEAMACDWDLLIVDEAHHLDWDSEAPSLSWQIINEISKSSKALLLLTATPRHRGLMTQYGLLHMIDPKKFSHFEDFVLEMELLDEIALCAKEISDQKKISLQIQEKLGYLFKGDDELIKLLQSETESKHEVVLSKLLDRYGTGRLIYRNRKCNLGYFPKRNAFFEPLDMSSSYQEKLKSEKPSELSQRSLIDYASGRLVVPGKPEEDKRAVWLAKHLESHKEKVFVICSSKMRVLDIAEKLKKLLNLTDEEARKRITLFHEDLDITQRDRQAALFSAPESKAQVLIASELGGEGRNFQFLKSMVLLDLPGTPEALEQRIGRLDRIGSGKSMNIYVPYLKDSPEEVFLKWYHDGLKAFTSQNPSHGAILENLAEDILETLGHFFPKSENYSERYDSLDSLVRKAQEELKEIQEELEKTQDILLDLNSFNGEETDKILEKIEKNEDNPHLESFVLSSLDQLGVDYEEYDSRGSIKLNSDSLSFIKDIPLFEELDHKILTFDRNIYLSQESAYFASFPSKFVQTLFEVATGEDQSKISFCSKQDSTGERKVSFQILFSLEAKGPKHLELRKYLPTNLKEYSISSKGELQKRKIKESSLEAIKEDSPYFAMIKSQKFINVLAKNLELIEKKISLWSKKNIEKAQKNAEEDEKQQLSHLEYLTRVNPLYTKKDLDLCEEKFKQIESCLVDSLPSLEAIRVILINP